VNAKHGEEGKSLKVGNYTEDKGGLARKLQTGKKIHLERGKRTKGKKKRKHPIRAS